VTAVALIAFGFGALFGFLILAVVSADRDNREGKS